MRAGVLASGCSFPKIQDNIISDNHSAGIIIRDHSEAVATGNKIFNNYYAFSTRPMDEQRMKNLCEDNLTQGDSEVIQCRIF